jgi:hypothetical protein
VANIDVKKVKPQTFGYGGSNINQIGEHSNFIMKQIKLNRKVTIRPLPLSAMFSPRESVSNATSI